MSYTIRYAKSFKKHVKKLNLSDKEKLYQVIEKLANNEILEAKYKDHALKGEYKDFRECHIKPDLLLIYQIQENLLILTCVSVGKHSELFG